VEEPVGVTEAWVSIEGSATIEDGGLELARRLIERYYTPEQVAKTWPSWEARAASWVTVRVTPARVRSSGL
jgi:hypothetical protein